MEIRKLEREHIPFFNKVRTDSVEYLHDPTVYTLEDNYKWYDNLKDPYFIVQHENENIGYIRTSNWTEQSLYVGMDIAVEHRGKGYATHIYEMFFKLLKHQFDTRTVYLEVLSSNPRAIHIYEKLGFKEITCEYHTTNGKSILKNIKMMKKL